MAAEPSWPSSSFRWLWGASATSLLGAEIGELALPLFALITLHANAGDVAMLRVAQFLPFLLLTLVLGVLVDRMRRKPLLVRADLGRGMILAVIVGIAWWGTLPIWLMALLVFAIGALNVLSQLADFSMVPAVVPKTHLAHANARLTSTQSAMSVAGSGVGGMIVQALSAPIALATNAVTYLLSALFITRVRVDEPEPDLDAPDAAASAWSQAREGLRFLRRNAVLRALAAEATIWNFANEILLLGLTVHLVRHFSLGPAILGAMLMASGVGAVLGALVSSRMTDRYGYGRSLSISMLVGNSAPLALVFLAMRPAHASVVVGAIALVLSGFGIGLAGAQAVTVRQLATPARLYGRVNAAYRFLSWGMVAIGAVVAGVVASAFGPGIAIIVGAVGTTVATVPILLSPVRRLRQLRDAADAAEFDESLGSPSSAPS